MPSDKAAKPRSRGVKRAVDRVLPYNVGAERSVIGAMLIEPTFVDIIKRILQPSDFWSRPHELICEAIYEVHGQGKLPDPVNVSDWLYTAGLMNNQGGQKNGVWESDISQAVSSCVSVYHAESHAKTVETHSLLRKVIANSEQFAREAYDASSPEEVSLLIGTAAQTFAGMIATSEVKIRPVMHGRGRILSSLREAKQRGLPTFLPPLNKFLGGGLYKGEVTVIGGMSSTGKTRLAVQIATGLARDGRKVIYNSLELYFLDVARLFVSHMVGLDNTQLRFGFNPKYDLEEISRGVRRYPHRATSVAQLEALIERGEDMLEGLPLWIFAPDYDENKVIQERISFTPESIRANVIGHVQQHGQIDVLIVDFLGKMDFGTNRTHGEQAMRTKYAMEILTRLAKELGIHIIVMHQMLDSALKVRQPNYTHLEGAKEIFQFADNILLLIAPRNHGQDCPKEMREILIPKNRFGESHIIDNLWYEGAIGYFGEAELSQVYDYVPRQPRMSDPPSEQEILEVEF